MKTETKAVAASLVVLLLALSSAGGVTYSWFSVSQEYNVDIGASELTWVTNSTRTGRFWTGTP